MESLETEVLKLIKEISAFMGAQVQWNEKHEERSREELGKIHKNIDDLFDLNKELMDKLGDLDCKEHSARLALNKDVVDQKIKVVETKVESVEKRFKWIWGLSGSCFLIMIGAVINRYLFGV